MLRKSPKKVNPRLRQLKTRLLVERMAWKERMNFHRTERPIRQSSGPVTPSRFIGLIPGGRLSLQASAKLDPMAEDSE